MYQMCGARLVAIYQVGCAIPAGSPNRKIAGWRGKGYRFPAGVTGEGSSRTGGVGKGHTR